MKKLLVTSSVLITTFATIGVVGYNSIDMPEEITSSVIAPVVKVQTVEVQPEKEVVTTEPAESKPQEQEVSTEPTKVTPREVDVYSWENYKIYIMIGRWYQYFPERFMADNYKESVDYIANFCKQYNLSMSGCTVAFAANKMREAGLISTEEEFKNTFWN